MFLKLRNALLKAVATLIILTLIGGLFFALINNNMNSVLFNNNGILSTTAKAFGNQIYGDYSVADQDLTMNYNSDDMLLSLKLPSDETIRSYPLIKAEDGLTALGRVALKVPVEFEYVTMAGDLKTVAPVTTPEIVVTPYESNKGLALEVNYVETGIYFIIEIALEKNRLVVTIPYNTIKDSPDARIVSITPFPLFGATRQGDEGYILLPDGSGSVTYFNKTHTIYEGKGYSKEIYGSDITYTENEESYSEQIRIPAYGIITNTSVLTGLISGGDSDSKIIMAPPGSKGISFYRAGVQFVYRKSYQSEISKGQFVTKYQKDTIFGDRQIMYKFTATTKGSYETCTVDYLQYLDDKGIKQSTSIQNDILIRIFMTIKKGTSFFSNKNQVLTTAKQAQGIAEQLLASDKNYSFEIAGFYKDGYASGLPVKYPVSKAIGGVKDLQQAIASIKNKGAKVWIEDNYSDNLKGNLDISLQKTGIKTPQERLVTFTELLPNGVIRKDVSHGFINPVFALEDINDQLSDLKNLGPSGITIKYIGQSILTDYNKTNPLLREQTIAAYKNQIELLSKTGFDIAVQGGNSYTFGNVLQISDVTFEISNTYLLDESVPFYSLIASKFADCYSSPLNLEDNIDQAILKSLEYGISPKFEVTYESAELLKNTGYEQLYASRFEDYKEKIIKAQTLLSEIGDSKLASHRKIDEKIFESTYTNGKKVLFNYVGEPKYQILEK